MFALVFNSAVAAFILGFTLALDVAKFGVFAIIWAMKFVQQLLFNTSRKYFYISKQKQNTVGVSCDYLKVLTRERSLVGIFCVGKRVRKFSTAV